MSQLVFWSTLIVTAGLFVLPYFLTIDAPTYDGSTVIGFPLSFYSFGGGMCLYDGTDGGEKITCGEGWFPIKNIIIDLLFVFGIPLTLSVIAKRMWIKKFQ